METIGAHINADLKRLIDYAFDKAKIITDISRVVTSKSCCISCSNCKPGLF